MLESSGCAVDSATSRWRWLHSGTGYWYGRHSKQPQTSTEIWDDAGAVVTRKQELLEQYSGSGLAAATRLSEHKDEEARKKATGFGLAFCSQL